MNVIFEIGSGDSILKITEGKDGLSVLCGVSTLCWGEKGKLTLEETLKDQEKYISKQLKNLNKTNRASKKGLMFLLSELNKDKQTILNL